MDIYHTAKSVLFEPKKFFSKMKQEGVGNALVYYIIFALVGNIFTAIYYAKSIQSLPIPIPLPGAVMLLFIVLYLALIILQIILLFVGYAVIHLFLILLKGKGTYQDTFNAGIYASTPGLVLGPLTGIILVLLGAESIAGIALMLAISIAATIYGLYLIHIGYSIRHKISILRVFLAVIVLPIIIVAVIGIAVGLLIAVGL